MEYGETGAEAITRELQEELRATATEVRYLGLIEDIFRWDGRLRHEIALVYHVEVGEREIYDNDELTIGEDDGAACPRTLGWPA